MRSTLIGTALILFAPFLQTASAKGPASTRNIGLGERVAEMLKTGFARGPTALAQAQAIHESHRLEAESDARIDFAYGLVLWRNMKNKDAQAEFQAATKRPGTPYWPAWEALIWSHFVAREYDAGYARLLEFAKQLQNVLESDHDARHDEIRWIGRVMAALELTLDSNPRREFWLQTEKKLLGLMDADAVEDYASGKIEVNDRHSQLEDEIRQARERAKERDVAKLEKSKTRIEQTQEAIKEKRENLKRSAAEMKESFAAQTAAYEKQMARLEKDYGYIERNSARLLTVMLGIDREITLLQQTRGNQNSASSNVPTAIAQLQNQRYLYNVDFQRNLALGEQISARARSLNEERAQLLAEYENATGEHVKEDSGMEKWKERTLKQEEALKKAAATQKLPVPVAKIQAVRTFRTYVEFDPLMERTKLLESFAAAVNEK